MKEYVIFSPIFGFRSKIKRLKIDESLLIKAVPEEMRKKLKTKRKKEKDDLRLHTLSESSHIIIKESDKGWSDVENFEKNRINITSSLLLLHQGNLLTPHTYLLKKGEADSKNDVIVFDRHPKWYPPSGYVFKQSGIREFKKLFSWIKENRSKINVGLRRFDNCSSDILSLEEKLIECMIGLESLYIKDNIELGFKLALRSAFILGRNKKEKLKIFHEVKKAYGLRGNIVHGSLHKIDPRKIIKIDNSTEIQFYQLVINIRNYLRESLLKFIRSNGLAFNNLDGKIILSLN